MNCGEVVIHESAEAFARAVRPLLEQDEAANGLSNPMSNSIYRKVGYVWVTKSAQHTFDHGTPTPSL